MKHKKSEVYAWMLAIPSTRLIDTCNYTDIYTLEAEAIVWLMVAD